MKYLSTFTTGVLLIFLVIQSYAQEVSPALKKYVDAISIANYKTAYELLCKEDRVSKSLDEFTEYATQIELINAIRIRTPEYLKFSIDAKGDNLYEVTGLVFQRQKPLKGTSMPRMDEILKMGSRFGIENPSIADIPVILDSAKFDEMIQSKTFKINATSSEVCLDFLRSKIMMVDTKYLMGKYGDCIDFETGLNELKALKKQLPNNSQIAEKIENAGELRTQVNQVEIATDKSIVVLGRWLPFKLKNNSDKSIEELSMTFIVYDSQGNKINETLSELPQNPILRERIEPGMEYDLTLPAKENFTEENIARIDKVELTLCRLTFSE